ncbi:DUF4304 domain-containing protein [Microbacterium gorillae]|uniref:DUF4304 domain-containing protein n=1 Tax=Microbacterium gorillae TaxID=1231063 RepID=UPI003D98362E
MDRTTINRELRTQFWPLLTAAGFERKGDIARRRLDGGVVHVVEVQHRPRSSVFQVHLGVHLLSLGGVAGGVPPEPDALREYDCAWRGSIIAGFRNASDAEFAYGRTAEEATESVAFLASEWERQSAAFFGPLTAFPDDFDTRARQVIAEAPHPAHMRTWARVALLLADEELAREIAAAALPRVAERATALREDLAAIADGV